MRRVKVAVPLPEAKRRVLDFLARDPRRLRKMNEFAKAIWPDTTFLNAQGAAAAASRIVKRLEREGLVRWARNGDDWGYRCC